MSWSTLAGPKPLPILVLPGLRSSAFLLSARAQTPLPCAGSVGGGDLVLLARDMEKETLPLASCLPLFSSSPATVHGTAWRRTGSQHVEPDSWLTGWSRAPVFQSFGNEGLGLAVEGHIDPTV